MSSSPPRSSQQTEEAAPQTQSMRQALQELFAEADVQINGDRPWDLQVHDTRLYRRVLAGRSMALGESYMDGWWDAQQLDEFFHRVLKAELDRKTRTWRMAWNHLKARMLNLQRRSKAFQIGERHYDRGNDLFERMLDPRMVYSCGYWKEAHSLAEAQEAKLDLICRKIGLKPGMRVLDIGCGWGSFLQYAAEEYGAEGVGVTVSKEQAKLGRERCAGLPVEIRLQDYRDLQGEPFDRVVSIGMFEHVGPKNYETFFDVARRCLRKNGLMLLHTIGSNRSVSTVNPWIDKYIFPNGSIPSPQHITHAAEGRFVLEDWHNFGADYDRTLMAWHENFERHWEELKGRYDERFHRMWRYYLLACAGVFRARRNHLWQVVFSPEGVPGGYERVQ